MDGDDLSKVPKEEDPFWEPPEDVLIGTASVFLQSLSYALDFDDKLSITDYKVCVKKKFYLGLHHFLLRCLYFYCPYVDAWLAIIPGGGGGGGGILEESFGRCLQHSCPNCSPSLDRNV